MLFFRLFMICQKIFAKNGIHVDGEEGDPEIDPDLSGQNAAPDFGVLRTL